MCVCVCVYVVECMALGTLSTCHTPFPSEQDKDSGKEEEEYKDSNVFLKGTQSANPHNDYCQHFVDTGQRPHNFIRDTGGCGLWWKWVWLRRDCFGVFYRYQRTLQRVPKTAGTHSTKGS